MYRFTFRELKATISNTNVLLNLTDKMHFYATFFFVEKRMVFKLIQIEIRTKFTINAI